MKLYRYFNNEQYLLGEPQNSTEVITLITADAQTRFVHLSGRFELEFKPGVVYADSEDKTPGRLRYELKDE